MLGRNVAEAGGLVWARRRRLRAFTGVRWGQSVVLSRRTHRGNMDNNNSNKTYPNAAFADSDLERFVLVAKANPFALVVTGENATWVPVMVREDEASGTVFLDFHLAAYNPHGEAIQAPGAPATLVAFLGPHGYVSPRWFQDPSRGVPTWNYIAYHVVGHPKPVTGRTEKLAALRAMVDEHEARLRGRPWTVTETSPAYLEAMLEGLTAFTMEVTTVRGIRKLSQNRGEEDRIGIALGLIDSNQVKLGLEMRRELASNELVASTAMMEDTSKRSKM